MQPIYSLAIVFPEHIVQHLKRFGDDLGDGSLAGRSWPWLYINIASDAQRGGDVAALQASLQQAVASMQPFVGSISYINANKGMQCATFGDNTVRRVKSIMESMSRAFPRAVVSYDMHVYLGPDKTTKTKKIEAFRKTWKAIPVPITGIAIVETKGNSRRVCKNVLFGDHNLNRRIPVNLEHPHAEDDIVERATERVRSVILAHDARNNLDSLPKDRAAFARWCSTPLTIVPVCMDTTAVCQLLGIDEEKGVFPEKEIGDSVGEEAPSSITTPQQMREHIMHKLSHSTGRPTGRWRPWLSQICSNVFTHPEPSDILASLVKGGVVSVSDGQEALLTYHPENFSVFVKGKEREVADEIASLGDLKWTLEPARKHQFFTEWRVTDPALIESLSALQSELSAKGGGKFAVLQSCAVDNLHITMNEMTLTSVTDVHRVLRTLIHFRKGLAGRFKEQDTVSFVGMGQFKNRVAYVPVSAEGEEALSGLFDELAEEMATLSVPLKKLDFVPHVTLGKAATNDGFNDAVVRTIEHYASSEHVFGEQPFGELVFCVKRTASEATPPVLMRIPLASHTIQKQEIRPTSLTNVSTDHKKLRETWDVVQRDIAGRIDITDSFNIEDLRFVGGTDISFVRGTNTAVACVVVLSFPDLRLIDSEMHTVELDVPYIAGYLAFREVNPLLEVLRKLQKRLPREQWPQCWVVDGNGVLHPRDAGLACHFGVLGNCCSLGVAKNLLMMPGLDDTVVHEALKGAQHGQPVPLRLSTNGKLTGHVAQFGGARDRPIYISPGHRIGFDLAAEVVRRCAIDRVPEPTRVADEVSRKYVQDHFGR